MRQDQHAARLRLYELGWSDGRIGRKLGKSTACIQQWRNRNGLCAAVPPAGTPLAKPRHDERMVLWRRGLSDSTIAKRLGTSSEAIRLWRRRNKLVARHGGANPFFLSTAEDERRLMLYRRGLGDTEIARLVGITRPGVAKWRSLRGLDANPRKREALNVTLTSLDADRGETGFTLHGLIADDAASAWLEEMGATRW